MGINLKNVAAYIHSQPPSALEGLFHAVEAKCKALNLTPGRRDNVAGGEEGASPNINIRGVLTFVEGVSPITEEEKKVLTADSDKPVAGDSLVVLAEKENRRANLPVREAERKAHVAAKQSDLDDLRRLYGTLQARFASSGYKPKPVAPEATVVVPSAGPPVVAVAKPPAATNPPSTEPIPNP